MTLSQQRCEFSENLAFLIIWANSKGLKVAVDFVKRCEDCKVGHPRSFHKRGLAADLNLYRIGIDGELIWLDKTEDHEELGKIWEILGGTWGGRFKSPDGNHYSWGEK